MKKTTAPQVAGQQELPFGPHDADWPSQCTACTAAQAAILAEPDAD